LASELVTFSPAGVSLLHPLDLFAAVRSWWHGPKLVTQLRRLEQLRDLESRKANDRMLPRNCYVAGMTMGESGTGVRVVLDHSPKMSAVDALLKEWINLDVWMATWM
jgi:hypothetical protein